MARKQTSPSDIKRRQVARSRSTTAKAVRAIVQNGEYAGLTTAIPSKQEIRQAKRTVSNGKVPLRTFAVFRDVNGIAYLRVAFTDKGAEFIVNKGFHVELVHIDRKSSFSLYLQPVVGASVYAASKNLLHPLNDNVTISLRAKQHLEAILKNEKIKELETMKTQATGKAAAKFATVTAPAAKSSKKTATGSKADASAKSAKTTAKAAAPRSTSNELYETKVVATKKAEDAREGSFFHTVGKLAKKPIVLETLIQHVTAEVKKTLRSDKDAETVCRTRVRDAYTRLGFLKEAK